ncbi:MAG TPA: hypothetical protein VHZ03_35510 [Trebonia sp.]|nr:hypothetical protein [Trebonia sp.]
MLVVSFDADGVDGGFRVLLGELLHDVGDDDAGAEADGESTRGAARGLDAAAGRGRATSPPTRRGASSP